MGGKKGAEGQQNEGMEHSGRWEIMLKREMEIKDTNEKGAEDGRREQVRRMVKQVPMSHCMMTGFWPHPLGRHWAKSTPELKREVLTGYTSV